MMDIDSAYSSVRWGVPAGQKLQSVGSLPQLSGVCLAGPAGSLAAHGEVDRGHWLDLASQRSQLAAESAGPMFREVPCWD